MNPRTKRQILSVWEKWGMHLLTLIFIVIGLYLFGTQPETKAESRPFESPDTFIPAGFVLIPLHLENSRAIEPMIGSHGVVDLFAVQAEQAPRLLASQVRIVRAPLDPTQFAVLIEEEKSGVLIQNHYPVRAIIQNPEQSSTRVIEPVQAPNRIRYGDSQ